MTNRIPAELFVRIWQESASAEDAAHRIGVTRSAASSRATWLRQKGIELRKFPVGRHKMDVGELKKIVGENVHPAGGE